MSADGGALEEQLRRDAQVQLDVERIHVRDERARGGAAGLRLQHGRLDLDVSARSAAIRAASAPRPRGGARCRARAAAR